MLPRHLNIFLENQAINILNPDLYVIPIHKINKALHPTITSQTWRAFRSINIIR